MPVFSISPTLHNAETKEAISFCSCSKPGSTFYAKADVQKILLEPIHAKATAMLGTKDHYLTQLIASMKDIKIRREEHGRESKWRRSGGGGKNTTEIVTLVLTVPNGSETEIHQIWTDVTKYFMRAFKKRKNNSAGEVALAHAEGVGAANGHAMTKGLYGYLVKSKGDGDPEKAVEVMNEELSNHWKNGISFEYDVSLDKYLVDYDIKEFLAEHLGINSWDDLDEDGKKACYRDYPRRALPDWNSIVMESY
jgi:hypothetical protein